MNDDDFVSEAERHSRIMEEGGNYFRCVSCAIGYLIGLCITLALIAWYIRGA